MTSDSGVAMLAVPAAGLLLRELAPGFLTLSGPSSLPVAVAANTAIAGEVVQANALADDIFTLVAKTSIDENAKVQLSTLGTVEALVEGGVYLGRAVTGAKAAGDRIKIAVDTSTIYGQATGGGGSSASFIAPSSDPPNGVIVGEARGQTYTQLDPTETYTVRLWTFNGTPATNTGWI
jgi:hypothetical protein